MIKAATSTSAAIERIARGLEWADAKFGAKNLGVPLDRLAVLVGVPRSTFIRQQNEGRFTEAETEHIMRFARLGQVAGEVFRSEAGARSWLNRAQVGFDGNVPMDYAKSELGARVVEDLMRQIHDGILAKVSCGFGGQKSPSSLRRCAPETAHKSTVGAGTARGVRRSTAPALCHWRCSKCWPISANRRRSARNAFFSLSRSTPSGWKRSPRRICRETGGPR